MVTLPQWQRAIAANHTRFNDENSSIAPVCAQFRIFVCRFLKATS